MNTRLLALLFALAFALPAGAQTTSSMSGTLSQLPTELTPAEAASTSTVETSDPSAAAPVNVKAALAPPLRIAFAYVGRIGDEGWSYAHDLARKAVEREFGKLVQVTYVEGVPEGPAGQRVFYEMVRRGNTLVFGTAFGYKESLQKVASEYPKVMFEHATGYRTADNLRVYDVRTYEGAYLAGVLAGSTTKSKVLGVVASIPIPEVIRSINSFTLGARSVVPGAKVKVSWVNSWYDPPRENRAAMELIDAGVDVLMQTTDSTEVLAAAERRGKRAIGWYSDMKDFAPHAHLGSAVVNFSPYYIKAVNDALKGTWSTGQSWWGVKEGSIDLVSISPDVSASTVQRLERIKTGLREGSFDIWAGPLTNQTGKQVLGAGQSLTDDDLGTMSFFVRGVDAKIPN